MLGFKFIHVSKRGPWWKKILEIIDSYGHMEEDIFNLIVSAVSVNGLSLLSARASTAIVKTDFRDRVLFWLKSDF